MPNFCKNSTVLLLILSVLIGGLCMELVMSKGFVLADFSLRTVYLSWIVLGSAMCLCLLKRWGVLQEKKWLAVLTCLAVMLLVESVTQWQILESFNLDRLIRYTLLTLLLSVVVFRLFDLFFVYQRRSISRVEARMQGLQSKIEPHFLFNSLNTIAELAHMDADKAEESIQSLSALLRNNLADDDHLHSLAEELSLTNHYIELERLRLGDRIRLKWIDDIESSQKKSIMIPKLTLQPLVENAFRYGVAPSVDGGDVEIHLTEKNKRLAIKVVNSLSAKAEEIEGGAGIALKNIRERLFLIYDDKQKFSVAEKGDSYQVNVLIPKSIDRWMSE